MFDLARQVNDFLSVEKDGLMWMIRSNIRGGDLGQNSWAGYSHEPLLVVEGQDLCRNVLDSRVDHIEPVLACVDVRDDSIVYVDEGFFSALDADEHPIK